MFIDLITFSRHSLCIMYCFFVVFFSNTVTADFKYYCEFCFKVYCQPQSLERHKKSCLMLRPFQCDFENCDKSFNTIYRWSCLLHFCGNFKSESDSSLILPLLLWEQCLSACKDVHCAKTVRAVFIKICPQICLGAFTSHTGNDVTSYFRSRINWACSQR